MPWRRPLLVLVALGLVAAAVLPWWTPGEGWEDPPVQSVWRTSTWWSFAVVLGLAGCVAGWSSGPRARRAAVALPAVALAVVAVEAATIPSPRGASAAAPVLGAVARAQDTGFDVLVRVWTALRGGTIPEDGGMVGTAIVQVPERVGGRDALEWPPAGTGPQPGLVLAVVLLALQLVVAGVVVSRHRTGSADDGPPRLRRNVRAVSAVLGIAVLVVATQVWWRQPLTGDGRVFEFDAAASSTWWVLCVVLASGAALFTAATARGARTAALVALGCAVGIVVELVAVPGAVPGLSSKARIAVYTGIDTISRGVVAGADRVGPAGGPGPGPGRGLVLAVALLLTIAAVLGREAFSRRP